MTRMDDHTLLNYLSRRDLSAFSQLYDTYASALYGCILQVVPDKDAARAILHESFKKIWADIHLYDPSKCRLFSWMIQVTVRYCSQVAHCTNEELVRMVNHQQPPVNSYQ